MKNFRTLNQAKKDLIAIQDYINLIESYEPQTLTQHIIHTYALLGNLQKTADAMNIVNKELTAADITKHITSKPAPQDYLHKQIKSLYRKRTRATKS